MNMYLVECFSSFKEDGLIPFGIPKQISHGFRLVYAETWEEAEFKLRNSHRNLIPQISPYKDWVFVNKTIF